MTKVKHNVLSLRSIIDLMKIYVLVPRIVGHQVLFLRKISILGCKYQPYLHQPELGAALGAYYSYLLA